MEFSLHMIVPVPVALILGCYYQSNTVEEIICTRDDLRKRIAVFALPLDPLTMVISHRGRLV
jgi:hypothetical protein